MNGIYLDLFLSLLIGLLIGLERGWKERYSPEGSRIAGIRTYGLIGLFGGAAGLISQETGAIFAAGALISLSLILAITYQTSYKCEDNRGITSVVASLLTFTLGLSISYGFRAPSVASAVIVMTILSLKPKFHEYIKQIEEKELYAILKLLIISAVLLPVLPNKGYGPWNALNPYEIWWMVVLIASISFMGYFAVKIAGTGKGLMLTSLFGGLASSTAVTLNLSKMAERKDLENVIAAGILIASGTMFPRMLFLIYIINRQMLEKIWLPIVSITVIIYLLAFIFWKKKNDITKAEMPLTNPFQLSTALSFGFLLTCIMFLSKAFLNLFGENSLFALSCLSGISDVNAITLAISKMSVSDITINSASIAILIAAGTNTVVKGLLSLFIGGKRVGFKVLVSFAAAIICGLMILVLF